jgi:hypothetical protein
MFERLQDALSSTFNKISQTFEPVPVSDEVRSGLKKLNEKLGQIEYVIKSKKQRFLIALNAPLVTTLYGGALVGGIGVVSHGLQYVSTDKPITNIYSTARIITNILKSYEKELKEVVPEEVLKQLENGLIKLHEQEKKLFVIVHQMAQLQDLVEREDIDDIGMNKLSELLDQAKAVHEKADKERESVLEKVKKSILPIIAVQRQL